MKNSTYVIIPIAVFSSSPAHEFTHSIPSCFRQALLALRAVSGAVPQLKHPLYSRGILSLLLAFERSSQTPERYFQHSLALFTSYLVGPQVILSLLCLISS